MIQGRRACRWLLWVRTRTRTAPRSRGLGRWGRNTAATTHRAKRTWTSQAWTAPRLSSPCPRSRRSAPSSTAWATTLPARTPARRARASWARLAPRRSRAPTTPRATPRRCSRPPRGPPPSRRGRTSCCARPPRETPPCEMKTRTRAPRPRSPPRASKVPRPRRRPSRGRRPPRRATRTACRTICRTVCRPTACSPGQLTRRHSTRTHK
mmetsp:Transcript_2818/g.9969  ORF Transcript_2818/g.9969 Transcript_2818/m.9969 type:complete len:209 (+) Transcript_2818:642-1268(+)